MRIWAHSLVKNEERYVWFAVESLINYVDKVLLWDTGSTDNTKEIISSLKSKYKEKIDVKFIGEVTPEEFTIVRQKMLQVTESDWFIVIDGDEVWWDEGINDLTNFIRENGTKYESIVNSYYNISGDIFHFQDESAGMYRIDDKQGHINIRATNRNIPGLHFAKPHGQQGLYDGDNVLIQKRTPKKRFHIEKKAYLHFTNVTRSSEIVNDMMVPKRKMKLKYELGKSFSRDFYYPECFFRQKPEIVSTPWITRSSGYVFKSLLQQPFKILKRQIRFLEKTGY